MSDAIKDSVLALFAPEDKPRELALPVAPGLDIEVIVCPHCDGDNCEVWSSTEAHMANCAECGAEFTPPVLESRARSAIMQITEKRNRFRRRVINSATAGSDYVKSELDRMFSR